MDFFRGFYKLTLSALFFFANTHARAIIFEHEKKFFSMRDFEKAHEGDSFIALNRIWPGVELRQIAPKKLPRELFSIGRIYPTGCTAFLVRSNKSREIRNTYGITNGHCFGMPYNPNNITIDLTTDQSFFMEFPLVENETGGQKIRLPIKTVLYQTMHNTDLAVFSLEFDQGLGLFKPYHLISSAENWMNFYELPLNMSGVPIIEAPGSGAITSVIRFSQCKLEDQVSVIEGDFAFPFSFRHKCNALHGSSGSPISYSAREGEVLVGIHNTSPSGEHDGDSCLNNYPCEVVGASKKRVPYNYAQPLTRMESCFDESGVFNSKLTGCYLDWPAATHGRISGNSLIFKKRSAKVILNLLNTFKASKTPFPVAGGKGGFEEDKKTIPWPSGDRWIEFWSNDIQLLLFGKVLFPTYLTSQRNLFHITLNIAFANNPDSHGHILISKNMLEAAQINTSPEMYRLYIQFLVSHEIAHYVYEWYLHTHASKYRSINGGISMDPSRKIREAYNAEQFFKDLTPKDFAMLSAQSHAEVDWIALEILKQMDMSISWDQYKAAMSKLYLDLSLQDSFMPVESINANHIRFETLKDSWGNF